MKFIVVYVVLNRAAKDEVKGKKMKKSPLRPRDVEPGQLVLKISLP